MVKNLPANAGDAREVGLIPGSGRSHSSILAWEIPGTEQPGGLRSMESLREGPALATEHANTVLTSGGKRGPYDLQHLSMCLFAVCKSSLLRGHLWPVAHFSVELFSTVEF